MPRSGTGRVFQRGSVYRIDYSFRGKRYRVDDLGGYRITDAKTDAIVTGARFDLDMDALETFLEDYERELLDGR